MDAYDQAWNALCNVQQRESLKHSRIAMVTEKLNEKIEREHALAQALFKTTPDKIVTTRATSGSETQVRSRNTHDTHWGEGGGGVTGHCRGKLPTLIHKGLNSSLSFWRHICITVRPEMFFVN